MDRLPLTVNYGGLMIQTLLFEKRLCWPEPQINAAFHQNRSIVDDPRAIRTRDYEVLCPREAHEMGCGAGGTVILFESGLAIAASDRGEVATHLRGLLVAAAEFRSLVEHLGSHEHHKPEGHSG